MPPSKKSLKKKTRRDTEEAAEEASASRDYVMARAGAALAELHIAVDALTAFMACFVAPDEDPKGKDRKAALEEALLHASQAQRGMEEAEKELPEIDPEESEPWDDEEDEPGDADDDEDEEDDEADEDEVE